MSLNMPYQLRASDIVRHIINIDSRFRDIPANSTATDFQFTLPSPIRNILRIRVTSIEFPNNYYFFTEKRKNISFQILYGTNSCKVIDIPDGNYTACEMETAITESLAAAGVSWLTVSFNEITGQFTFSGNQTFAIDTTCMSYNRPYDYGLGYYLGFTYGGHIAKGSGTSYKLTSDGCANFSGDSYVFLKVNDYVCVTHPIRIYNPAGTSIVDTTYLNALAKIILREPKNYMAFDDYASQHIKEVVFPSPTDVLKFRIQVVDAYGEEIDLCSAQWSFSMEIMEVRNSHLYTTIRDSLTTSQYR